MKIEKDYNIILQERGKYEPIFQRSKKGRGNDILDYSKNQLRQNG